MEETAYRFAPEAVTGIYLWRHPVIDRSFLRVAFCGSVEGPDASARLDRCIIRAAWLTRAELEAQPGRLRSPLVLRCIDDYLAGRRYPLSLLCDMNLAPDAPARAD